MNIFLTYLLTYNKKYLNKKLQKYLIMSLHYYYLLRLVKVAYLQL